jgi:hypothetical protein
MMPGMVGMPVVVGSKGQQTGYDAPKVIGLSGAEKRLMSAIVKNDESSNHETAGQNNYRQSQPK